MRMESAWKARLATGEGQSLAQPSERLVSALSADILDGLIRPGERLPAHRALAAELGIGLGTVSKAYSTLERRGLVRGSHGRGMFVSHRPETPQTHIDLATNAPPPMLSDSVISTALTAIGKRIDAGVLANYGPPGGRLDYRRTVANWVGTTGLELDPDELVLCSGAQQGIAAVLMSLSAGAVRAPVFTEELSYPGMLSFARLAGHPIHGVPMDEQGLDPSSLDRMLTHRADTGSVPPVIYVTPTLQNPTTATMSGARRRDVVRVARRHGAIIIEDDVYALSEDRPASALVSLAPERTYYVSSALKALSPGIRLGLIRPPVGRRDATIAAVRALALPVSPLLCELLGELMSAGVTEAIRTSIRQEGARRASFAREVLGSSLLKSSQSGYHVFAPFSRAVAQSVVAAADVAGVALTAPEAMMVDPSSDRSGIRICLGSPTMPDLNRGLGIIEALIARVVVAPRTREADFS